jgi:hypothetical protein
MNHVGRQIEGHGFSHRKLLAVIIHVHEVWRD